jgi:hypothetical protein
MNATARVFIPANQMNADAREFIPGNQMNTRVSHLNQIIKDIDTVMQQVKHEKPIDQSEAVLSYNTLEKLRQMKQQKIKDREALLSYSIWSNAGSRSRNQKRSRKQKQKRSRKQKQKRSRTAN